MDQRTSTELFASTADGDSISVSGFTPIELLMTITLLAIVVASTVPKLLSDNEEARRNTLLLRLHSVRGSIERFRKEHDGHFPVEGRNSAVDFVRALASVTERASESEMKVDARPLVDYQFPLLNPYTQKSEILVVPARLQNHHFSGNGRHGWAYSSTTGEFRSNLSPTMTDRSGRLINQL